MRKERLLCPSQKYDFKNKDTNINEMLRYMLRRSTQMFKYNGLPDSIPKYILELSYIYFRKFTQLLFPLKNIS